MNNLNQTMTLELITPEIAAKYMNTRRLNRPINRRAVALYSRILEQGRWKTQHQGIAFNDRGELMDGQHRLQAVIETGFPIHVWVARGVTDDAMATIDMCSPRNVKHVLTMYGFDSPSITATAVANLMMVKEDFTKDASVNKDKIATALFYMKYQAEIDFADNILRTARKKGDRVAGVRAAIACALICGVNRDELVRFGAVYTGDGIGVTAQDSAARAIREEVLRGNHHHTRETVFAKAQYAIKCFLEGKKVVDANKLKVPEKQIYFIGDATKVVEGQITQSSTGLEKAAILPNRILTASA